MTRWCFVLAFVTGCSFSLGGPDPKRPAHSAPNCETGKGRVLTDGLFATTMAVATVSIGATSGAAAILPAVVGAVFVGSAIHGNNVVEDCRKANAEYAALDQVPRPLVAEDPPAPPVTPEPPVAPEPVAAPAVVPPPVAWAAFWKEVR